MKNFNVKAFLANLVSKAPYIIYANLSSQPLIIPYYHMVSDDEVLHIKHLYPHKTIKQFIADIDFILKHFNPIHLNDLLAFLKQDNILPPQALLLTFDDGFGEMHNIVAPILLQKGISATFFLNSAFVDNKSLCYQHKASILVEHLFQKNISAAMQKKMEELFLQNDIKYCSIPSCVLSIKYWQRELVDSIADILDVDFHDYLLKTKPYLTTDQINKMVNDGFTIGAHSIDHPLYATLIPEEQVRQTIESTSFIRNKFKLNYGAFAFPHSDLSVSKKYFNEIAQRGVVDISFGTSGVIEDCVSNNFQRFSLEKPLIPAKDILALQSAKRLWRIVKRRNKIVRR